MGPARAAPGGGAAGSASPSGGGAKQRSGGALVPAAVGPGGGEAARCEHQRGQAALVRVQAGREVVQRRLAAHGGDGAVRPAAAWSRTSVETSRTRRNVESMSTSGSPRVDLSRQVKKSMIERGSSTATRAPSGFNGWRPGNLRFPVKQGSWLGLEGLGRTLERWRSFG